ncbi:DsbA family protein [Sphingomonas jaspsi]|uniref:DsbA family protein n=1 Tax=Sphingomonas jaspsi TaxID=392409 RepID=UPI0004B911A1|nr:thioredoxin domain-containing protein [Sphingomonas jaspsi]
MRMPLSLLVAALLAGPSIAQSDFAQPRPPTRQDYYVVGNAPVRALPGANLTVTYFFDYQCSACRRFHADVRTVFAADPKLRIIYRDTPIFGQRSTNAARAAMAAKYQRKHDAFHHALMIQPLPLDDAAIRAAAARAGVDWPRLQRDLALHGKAIDAQIAQNQNLSEAAGISGTPGFIIGDTLVDGALDAKTLRLEIADARKAKKR